jgi:RNA polymerase sigma factor (sigma-70 family)
MDSHHRNETDIINSIKDGNTREAMLYTLFEKKGWKADAIAWAMQHGAPREIAEEVAIDALIGLDRAIRNGNFEERSSLKTYFLKIVKFQWFKRASRQGKIKTQELLENMSPEEDPLDLPSEIEQQAYEQVLSQIGERCKQLLTLSIIDEESLKDVAEKFGLSSPEMAKKETYRCRLRMREFLEKHPAWIARLKGL